MEYSWLNNIIEWLGIATVVNIILLLFFSIRRKSSWSAAFKAQLLLFLAYQALFLFQDVFGLTISKQAAIAGIFLVGPTLFFFGKSFFTHKISGVLGHIIPVIICVNVMAYHLVPFGIIRILAFLHLLTYAVSMAILIRKETSSRGVQLFVNPGQRLTWFRNYFALIYLWIMYILGGLLLGYDPLTVWTSFSLSFIMAYIFWQVFHETEFYSEIPIGVKYAKSSLNPEQKYAILNRLEAFMKKEKYYLEPNASLPELSSKLNTTTHNLSQVISENRRSFFDMISTYRMRAACQILREPKSQQLKVEEVASQVGYNSKSAFNTAFKKYTGKTPTEFKVSKDVLTYGQEHLPNGNIHGLATANSTFGQVQILIDMIRNFFKIFFRNLNKNRLFSFLNLFGLTVGFTCGILIYLFISYELSYDKPIPQSDQIYRIAWLSSEPQTRTPHPMALAMFDDFPEVIAATSLSPWYGPGLTKQTVTIQNIETNTVFDEPEFYFADSTFFEVFDFKILQGDHEALSKPGGIVITESIASKYFGDQNPVGKTLTIGTNGFTATVSTVVEDPAPNLHFHFNFLVSYVSLKGFNPEDNWFTWNDFGHFNYIKVDEGVNPETLQSKIPEWALSYLNFSETSKQQLLSGAVSFILQPIRSIHLNSHLRWELEHNGNMTYVYILAATLLFILVIAIINYVNLTTAKSFDRAKEIGIRKTLGAVRSELSLQFFCESVTFVIMSLIAAVLLSTLFLDEFNHLSGQFFEITQILNVSFLLKIGAVAVFIGFISGLYPSIKLSSFIPSDVLKGKFTKSIGGQRLRNSLVTIQFAVSAILICGSLIILSQIDYLKSKPLGFDQELILSFPIKTNQMREQAEVIQDELNKLGGVITSSVLSNLPGSQFNNNSIYHDDPQNGINASELQTGFGVFDLMDLEIVEGRAFDRSFTTDSSGTSFMLNQVAIKALGLENPIGSKLYWNDDDMLREGMIVGVVEDFHYKSLHTPIKPLVIRISPADYNFFIVKINNEHIPTTLAEIEQVYTQFEPIYGFEHSFLDQQIQGLYLNEERTLEVFAAFASIALFLACLGLLGIAMAVLRQRIKEVGVRKILGASARQITTMIFIDFVKLILVAIIIGLPIAYYLMQEWISEFPYQVSIGPMPYLISGITLMTVAVLTISITTYKIAHSNPTKSLRYE